MAKKKSNAGRPTVMTKEIIDKLESAFAYGSTDVEACFFAGICHQALYDYQRKHPEFTERKEALKNRPIMLARKSVVDALKTDYNHAFKFLERKLKKEFGPGITLEGGDHPIKITVTDKENV